MDDEWGDAGVPDLYGCRAGPAERARLLPGRTIVIWTVSFLSSMSLPRRLFAIEEASGYLGLSTWTVGRMLLTGALSHLRCGRQIPLDLLDLETSIEREKVQGN